MKSKKDYLLHIRETLVNHINSLDDTLKEKSIVSSFIKEVDTIIGSISNPINSKCLSNMKDDIFKEYIDDLISEVSINIPSYI